MQGARGSLPELLLPCQAGRAPSGSLAWGLASGRASPAEGASLGATQAFSGHLGVTLALGSCPQGWGWLFNECKEIPLKNRSGFFLEEVAVWITMLCKWFLSVFVIFEDVQAVTEGLHWAGFSHAMLELEILWGLVFFTAYGHKRETFP